MTPPTDISRDYVAAALIGARDLILKMFGPDSSVFSARLAEDVFDYFDFPVTIVPVYVIIANPILVPLLNEGKASIYDKATWPKGGQALALGYRDNNVGGHLVAVSGDVMLDLALDHANRHGISLSARAFRITPAFLEGQPVQFEDAGCSMLYTRAVGERWWTKHPQWSRRDIRKGLAGDVITAIKQSL